ncbi:diphthine--ammonia ligase [Clostridium sp.]|uniref:Dph6-related ATP pyrophosphatase n=1 Tax=Clostridium sp. TaxID=1506 RepID=UPI0026DB2D5C|nr:diphthine--ammonia ligase [Clostridium sp.]MDO5038238.1 diphthine--ammonia ligase [Clostridium sp.]
MNFVLSYSCGKDSTLALYRLIKEGHNPVGLIVTVNKDENKSWFHGIPNEILEEVSKSLEIPLIKVECIGDNYEDEFEMALKKAKSLGATKCAFGDIDIEAHKKWCTDRCDNVDIGYLFPLWNEGREDLTNEFIDSGFEAIIKCCNNKELDSSFLGKTLTKDLVSQIKKRGADPCGENGEYHTFVCSGPIFKNSIEFKIVDRVIGKNYNHILISK